MENYQSILNLESPQEDSQKLHLYLEPIMEKYRKVGLNQTMLEIIQKIYLNMSETNVVDFSIARDGYYHKLIDRRILGPLYRNYQLDPNIDFNGFLLDFGLTPEAANEVLDLFSSYTQFITPSTYIYWLLFGYQLLFYRRLCSCCSDAKEHCCSDGKEYCCYGHCETCSYNETFDENHQIRQKNSEMDLALDKLEIWGPKFFWLVLGYSPPTKKI